MGMWPGWLRTRFGFERDAERGQQQANLVAVPGLGMVVELDPARVCRVLWDGRAVQ